MPQASAAAPKKASAKGGKLVIVESPAKAKTIKKMLGRGYSVMASVGHIRDLDSKGRGKKAFGVDLENGFEPRYVVIPGKKKTVDELKAAAAKASEVYLAPDPDREGEAIAWHLKEALGLNEEQAKRITYQAVTKKAVTEALENPRSIDMNLVGAQKGRRVLDRIVGFSLSPFLWKKVAKKPLSWPSSIGCRPSHRGKRERYRGLCSPGVLEDRCGPPCRGKGSNTVQGIIGVLER
jgi:DNA topoisomerase IA